MFQTFRTKSSRQVLTVMTGTTLAQVVSVVISPLLGRLYTPVDFGLYALFMSLVLILMVGASGKYEMAILLPEADADAFNILCLGLLVAAGFCSIALILAVALNPVWTRLLHQEGFGPWMALAPVTVWVSNATLCLSNWAVRTQHYSDVARVRICVALASALVSVGLGLQTVTTGGMIIAYIVGQVLGLGMMLWLLRKHWFRLAGSVSRNSMMTMALRYKRFPQFSILSNISETIASQMPVLLMTSYFGSAVVGFFSLGQRVVRMPMSLISSAIGDVFRQKASAAYVRDGQCADLFRRTARMLFLFSIVPFILLYVFAPSIISFIFGSQWKTAGDYLQIMTLMCFLQFTSSPLSAMFIIAEKQSMDLVIQISLVVLTSAAIWFGHFTHGSPGAAILLFSLVYCFKYVIEFSFSRRFSQGPKNIPKSVPLPAL